MKIAEQVELAAREAYYQTLSSNIAGGRMQILSADNTVLAEIPFPGEMALATAEGFNYKNLPETEVQKMGDPVAFKILSADGREFSTGTIGVEDTESADTADMVIAEKDKRLFPGMQFNVEEFILSKPKATTAVTKPKARKTKAY